MSTESENSPDKARDLQASGTLFRSAAIDAASFRWFAPVSLVRPPGAVAATLSACGVLLALLLALILIEITDASPAIGVLLPPDGILDVIAPVDGRVAELTVSDQSTVSAGEVLMHLDAGVFAPGRLPVTAQSAASLRRELDLLSDSSEQQIHAAAQTLESAVARRTLLQRQVSALQTEASIQQKQMTLHQRRGQRLETLSRRGLVSKQVIDDATAESLEQQLRSQAQQRQQDRLSGDVRAVDEEIRHWRVQSDVIRMQTAARRESLLRELAKAEVGHAVAIEASMSGRVTALAVTSGQQVRSGHVLLSLVNPADSLEARLYVSAANAATVEAGQSVEIELAAFPAAIFGKLTGVIRQVSTVAVDAGRLRAPPMTPGPVFEVRATLERQYVDADGQRWPLQAGTVVAASLVRHRMPLYRWLLGRVVPRV